MKIKKMVIILLIIINILWYLLALPIMYVGYLSVPYAIESVALVGFLIFTLPLIVLIIVPFLLKLEEKRRGIEKI